MEASQVWKLFEKTGNVGVYILYKRLLEKIQLHSFQFERPKLVLAKLQNDAGIIGAVLV